MAAPANLSGAIARDIAVNWNDAGLWRGVDGLVAGCVLRVPHVGDGVLGLDKVVPIQGGLVQVKVSQDIYCLDAKIKLPFL